MTAALLAQSVQFSCRENCTHECIVLGQFTFFAFCICQKTTNNISSCKPLSSQAPLRVAPACQGLPRSKTAGAPCAEGDNNNNNSSRNLAFALAFALALGFGFGFWFWLWLWQQPLSFFRSFFSWNLHSAWYGMVWQQTTPKANGWLAAGMPRIRSSFNF